MEKIFQLRGLHILVQGFQLRLILQEHLQVTQIPVEVFHQGL